ncbi:hypothetical protein GLOIN_2v151826 [Rhizophagus clarus]|uniref:Uncharacterized protein n=1 Tax=Rhizophagus clarus TaxID=94130 RepID=A0A8H3L4P9_9GLOM|nr:hypothetical protein GLOIN_2v151826 [Rhizophagus clarus]
MTRRSNPLFHRQNYNQRNKRNNLDKLWLAIENRGEFFKKRTLIREQLVSCEGIQIGNVGNKRSHESEESLSVDISKNDGKHENEDEEMSSLENPIIKKLKDIDGIARYRIIFLPEVEKRLAVNGGVDRCIEDLLNKYDDAINKAMIGYSVNLREIIGTFNKCPLIKWNYYIFSKEWPLQWTQSVYNAFSLCFSLAVNPLHNGDYQIGFGEVIGNACEYDDAKMERNREKILKSMQLGLFQL